MSGSCQTKYDTSIVKIKPIMIIFFDKARGRSTSVPLYSWTRLDQDLATVTHLRKCILSVIVKVKGVSRRRGQDQERLCTPGLWCGGPGPGDCEPSETGLSRVSGARPPPATPPPSLVISVGHLSNTFTPHTLSKCVA